MKWLWNICALICSCTLLSAVSLAIEANFKETYNPGETVIASIEGNFISAINKDAVSFYDGRIQIPLLYDLAKIEDKYYLSIQLQNQQRNYTLKIKNAHFIDNGLDQKKDLEFNITVSGNITDFSIDPGLVITNNDFAIKIQSKGKTLTVSAKLQNTTKSITIPAGQTRDFYFALSEFPDHFSFLELSSQNTKYLMPVKIITPINISNYSAQNNSLEFTPSAMNITALRNSKVSFTILLKNTGSTKLENITIGEIVSQNIKIIPSFIEILHPSDSKEINITFSAENELSKMIRALSSEQTRAHFLLNVKMTENRSEVIIPEPPALEPCALLGGKICALQEECKGDIISSREGKCCKGACEIPTGESNTGRYIAIAVILLIIILIIYFAYKKSRAKKKVFSDVLQEKSKTFEQKIHPEPPDEVKGKLTKT